MAFVAAAAATASGVASLAGSALDYKAQKKISKELAKQAKARESLIIKYGQRQVDSLDGGYNAAKDTKETADNRNLSLTGQTLKPMIEVGQAGDNLSQQMLNAGVTNSRAARRGDAVDNSLYTPQNVAVNYNALTGLTNPEPVQYAGFEQPNYGASSNTEAQESWTSGSASQYLKNYPELSAYYEKNKRELIKDSGNDIFNSAEGYAKWHWDNYGKDENRTFLPLTTNNIAQTSAPKAAASFTNNNVRAALNSGMGGFEGEGEEYGRAG